MYYLLNFYDHTFKTCNTREEVLRDLNLELLLGTDISDFEIVNCFDDGIRTEAEIFMKEEE